MHPKALPPCFSELMQHPRFTECFNHLVEHIQQPCGKFLIFVVGPAGVGKTTLLDHLKVRLSADAEAEMSRDPEILPYGGCSVKAHGQTAFSWKDTYIQKLQSLKHPFADAHPAKDGHAATKNTTQSTNVMHGLHRVTNDRLFRMVQKAIEHRKPRAMLLDEAHHLLRVGSSQSLLNQVEHLKYIADETRTPHVLFGTYELLRLIDLDSALIRRREVIHFSRYAFDPKDAHGSLKPFAELVSIFARDLDGISKVDLLSEVPLLYQGSVGCLGLLRPWLLKAYSSAVAGRTKITKDSLVKAAPTTRAKKKALETMQKGEGYFRYDQKEEDDYLVALGFKEDGSIPPDPKKSNSRVGHRKPHNDPTGVDSLRPGNDVAE